MKKNDDRSMWYIPILLVLTLSLTFWQTIGQAGDQPSGKSSSGSQTPSEKPEDLAVMFKGTVVEIIDGGRYAYLQIDTGDKRVWVAVPTFDGKLGDEVLVPPGVPVADFQSKKLNRKFNMIYFVGSVRQAAAEHR